MPFRRSGDKSRHSARDDSLAKPAIREGSRLRHLPIKIALSLRATNLAARQGVDLEYTFVAEGRLLIRLLPAGLFSSGVPPLAMRLFVLRHLTVTPIVSA